VKQHLAAIRMFDYLVTGHVMFMNPASSVRGPKYVVKRGKTPVLEASTKRARSWIPSTPAPSSACAIRALIGDGPGRRPPVLHLLPHLPGHRHHGVPEQQRHGIESSRTPTRSRSMKSSGLRFEFTDCGFGHSA
jgi:hypothetical protein